MTEINIKRHVGIRRTAVRDPKIRNPIAKHRSKKGFRIKLHNKRVKLSGIYPGLAEYNGKTVLETITWYYTNRNKKLGAYVYYVVY